MPISSTNWLAFLIDVGLSELQVVHCAMFTPPEPLKRHRLGKRVRLIAVDVPTYSVWP